MSEENPLFQPKSHYNILRDRWLLRPNGSFEPWQVDNYREFTPEELFDKLRNQGLKLSRQMFLLYSDHCESPEELVENLIKEGVLQDHFDQCYLLLFELWRRLLPEKLSLSVFCDELDHEITLYRQMELEDPQPLLDIIAALRDVLEENVDAGTAPEEAFDFIDSHTAHDLHEFLLDFIADEIEEGHFIYAKELIEGFSDYLDSNWLELLRAKIFLENGEIGFDAKLKELLKIAYDGTDIDFRLELLSLMVEGGNENHFIDLSLDTLSHLETREQFEDLVLVSADFFRRLDREERALEIERLIERESFIERIPSPFNTSIREVQELKKLLHLAH